jgi:4-amino-4-deoxy-L-arabinose transferase-like glycosyltransferase
VAGLTALALGLRLATIGQSLYGDEVLTYGIVTRNGLLGVIRDVHDTSITPPFHYVLAWLAVQVGDPTVWVRIPSLVLGTATVPLTYLLGLRTLGRRAALVAAAILTLSPFAIFYSVEARAYATLIFLIALSTLALLEALETRRARWWVVYGVAAVLVLYTHYTGAFALLAQAAWAFVTHRERLRELVVVHGAIGLGYLAWLPSFVHQHHNSGIGAIQELSATVSPNAVATALLNVFPGHPFIQLRDLPGRPEVIVVCVVVGAALVLAAARVVAARVRPEVSREQALIVIVALATPVGVVLSSLVGTDLLLPRNLCASLAATALAIAWPLVSLRRLPAAAAVAAVLAAVGVGTVKSLGSDDRRPPSKDAAQLVDRRSRPGDVLVFSTLSGALHVYLKHPLKEFSGIGDSGGWRYAEARAGRVFVVRPHFGVFAFPPRPPGALARRFRLTTTRIYPGFQPLAVYEYTPVG